MWFESKFKLTVLLIITILKETTSERGCPPQEAILPCRCLVRGKEYQIWCSHSNLASVLEGLKSIGEYITTPIDELILENNYLPSLPGRSFATLKILRLMLRYNTLERVSNDWLAGLETSLMELFIVEPKLNSLPQMSIEPLKNLKAVTLRSKLLKRLPLFSGLPLLRYVQIESSSLIEITPSNFKDTPSLEKIHIQYSPRLNRLEANLFENLPKLDLINITHCGLNWIHPRTFSRLPALKELSLIGNKITDPGMIGRASRELPELEILRLDFNYIGTLEEATFVDMPAVKNIHLSNNVIGEMRKGAFHRLTSLKTLDLSKNMLRRIQRQSFLQPISLEELNLKHNDITDVIQFRSVLEDLPKLVYLDLSYNKLDAIPFGSLVGHSTLEQLNLGYNRLQHVDKEAFILMPALRELTLTNNSVIDNIRVPFWNLPALKGLDISKNYLRRLEHSFLDNVGMLRRADLSLNHLSFIDPEAFLATPLLEHINISSNGLKMVHPATFRHLTQLYELDVSRNYLKNLVPGLPGNIEHLHLRQNEIIKISAEDLLLPSLRLLDLSENRIQSLEEGHLRSLGRLKKLYLKSNSLRHLAERSLDGLLQLEILDISNNRLSEINPISMKSISELKTLNVANNELTLIGPALLSNAKHLRKFNASQNQLAEILPGTFDANLSIEEIDLSKNLLVQFPETIYGLGKLKRLDLSRNRLKNLNATIISSLVNLREIKLSRNFIQILEADTFNHLKYLKTIFLDENDIMLVETNSIKMLPVLKLIKLDKNKIEQLPTHAFNTLLSLQNVELQENNLRYMDAQAFHLVPQLLTLNLSFNEIFKMEDVGLKSLRSLELLDMSFNKITIMSPNLDDLEWLVELRLKNNFICEVDEGVFGNMPRLKVLDLRNNKLVSFPEVAVERLRENTAQLDVTGNPLECSCDMLWLKSWLREASQASPRCSDGTLLREMPLSSRDCPTEKQRDRSFTGCNTELLNAPNFQNPQLLSKYASLRNFSLNGKNNLAPNPQESEYFYDDYIDYPFNASVVDPSGYLTEKIKDKNSFKNAEKIPIITKQAGSNATGNTPVLYAASSKKQKPDIPPKVPHSPSTSGFTFFGIPLPPLNLNNIFGKKGEQTSVQQAERKTAIMNNPRKDKRQPTPKLGGRKPTLELQVGRLQPPQPPPPPRSMPELEGGFMPILPGYGGFKPIPDPSLTTSTISTTILNQRLPEEIIQVPFKQKPHEEQIVHPATVIQTENTLDKKNFNLELVSNKSSLSISADSTSVINNRNKKSQLVDGDVKINKTRLESIENIQFFNKSELHHVEEYPVKKSPVTSEQLDLKKISTVKPIIPTQETTHFPEPTTSTTSTTLRSIIKENTTEKKVVPTSLISQLESHVKEPELSGMETQIKVAEEKLSTTTVQSKIVTEETITEANTLKNSTTGSLLSTLLVPGGNQPYFKPTAKSKITRVASPHGSGSSAASPHSSGSSATSPHGAGSSAPLLSSLEVSDTVDFPPNLQKPSLDEAIMTSTEENKNDWYFQNYNKNNLEPFVAKIINNSGGGFVGNKFVVGVLGIFLMVYG